MKAWVLHNIGNITLDEVTIPQPAAGEVLLKVRAAGICGSDIPRIYDTGAHSMPLIPGHEFAGEVAGVGAGVSDSWIGKRTGVFPLIPCRRCRPCSERRYEMCRGYSYLGSRRDGGFAEYVVVPEWNLIELAANVSYEEAAMSEPMAVAVHAIRRVQPKANETVVVYGLGTIGELIVMFLVDMGIKNILVVGNKEFQRKNMLKLGISENNYCDGKSGSSDNVKNWLMERTDGYGADVVFECVGNNTTVAQAIDIAVPAGRVCMVGNPHSDMELPRDVYWKLLRHQLVVTGTWNSTYYGFDASDCAKDDWHYVQERLAKGAIHPAELITHRYGMEELCKGFEIMHNKTEGYVKIMVEL